MCVCVCMCICVCECHHQWRINRCLHFRSFRHRNTLSIFGYFKVPLRPHMFDSKLFVMCSEKLTFPLCLPKLLIYDVVGSRRAISVLPRFRPSLGKILTIMLIGGLSAYIDSYGYFFGPTLRKCDSFVDFRLGWHRRLRFQRYLLVLHRRE
jgi:hypothetical protein